MLECKDVRPLLAEYEAGSLPEEQAAQMADHLLLCPICAAALEDLRRAQERAAMSQVDALFSAAPRSLGTPNPLAAEKAAPAPDAHAPAAAAEDAPEPVSVTEAAPRRKLPRWGKVLLALGALVTVLGIGVGVLWSLEVFAIRDRVKSGDGRLVAVIYEGTAQGEAGFRVRLWDTEKKEWYDEVAFLDAAYQQMQWAPNGVYLAVGYENYAQKDTAEVLLMSAEGVMNINLYAKLQSKMNSAEGYLGNTPLVDVPDCSVLGWMPDGSALLLTAQGEVDTNIDPDYGIEFAGAGSSTVQPRASRQYMDATAVSGVLSFDVNSYQLTVLSGFGLVSDSEAALWQLQLRSRFYQYMEGKLLPVSGAEFFSRSRQEAFDEDALLRLPQLVQDGVTLYCFYDMGADTGDTGFSAVETDLSLLAGLEDAGGILLVQCHGSTLEDPVEFACLVIPYGGAAQ